MVLEIEQRISSNQIQRNASKNPFERLSTQVSVVPEEESYLMNSATDHKNTTTIVGTEKRMMAVVIRPL